MDLITPTVNKKAQTLTGESQLRQFGQFLNAHDQLLDALLADDAGSNRYRNTAQPTSAQCAPCALHIDRREDMRHFQLASTNNTILNKIVCVFAELCTESLRLRALAEEQQLRFLFVDDALLRQADGADNEVPQQQQSLIVRLSEQLQFLCEIQYMVQRCLVVGTETLRQMGAFFGSKIRRAFNRLNHNFIIFSRYSTLQRFYSIRSQYVRNQSARPTTGRLPSARRSRHQFRNLRSHSTRFECARTLAHLYRCRRLNVRQSRPISARCVLGT